MCARRALGTALGSPKVIVGLEDVLDVEPSVVPADGSEGLDGSDDWPWSGLVLVVPPSPWLLVVPPDEGELSAAATPVKAPKSVADRAVRSPTRSRAKRTRWVA